MILGETILLTKRRWMRPVAASFIVAASLLAFGLGPAASVQAQPSDLRPGGESRVVAVADGDTLTLEDGRTVRLVGIQTPKLPLGRRGFVAEPLADQAKAALASLTLGKVVRLYYGGRETDRYSRHLAHLYLADGTWVQGGNDRARHGAGLFLRR